MHTAGRPAERNLQLVTFLNREQREIRKNRENYGWILARLPLRVAVLCRPNTETDILHPSGLSEISEWTILLGRLDVTHPPLLIWEISRDGDQSRLMDSLTHTRN